MVTSTNSITTITTIKEAGTQVMVTTAISIINVTKDLVEPVIFCDVIRLSCVYVL